MSRVSQARLLKIATQLGEREQRLVGLVDRLGLVSHAQLAVIDREPTSAASLTSQARMTRRLLTRLVGLDVLARLSRRVGGVRAGSAGFVYYLGPVGQRLIAYWQGMGLVRGRFRPEPGERYVRHRLSVSQLYVGLLDAERRGELEMLSFEVEPSCWRRHLDGFGGTVTLKPDAYVRLGIGAYEDRCFVEVDLGTESRVVLARKLRVYLDYFRAGIEQATHGVFPRVLLLTDSEPRRAALVEVCQRLPAEDWRLFQVGRLTDVPAVFGAVLPGESGAAL